MKLIKHLLLLTLLFHCSSTEDKDDPLKNSKKLIKDGHKSLFYNGAFEVKGSSIKLIPAYSESEVYIYGKRLGFAEKSFSENVKKAAESVYILKEGTKISLNVAGKVSDKTDKINSIIYDKGTKGGVYIIYKSLAESYGIIGSSFSKGLSVH
ncbi:MAG: hypothetical protein KDK36_11530, partial [Leptospiraceae bacterium]|nr:hypothetical protein [Leptospiraceae bacterium]